MTEFDPAADEPTIEFFDAKVRHAYAQTKRQTVVVALFSLLSVVISLMGVFGIVLFETRHRRREIAVPARVRSLRSAGRYGCSTAVTRRF